MDLDESGGGGATELVEDGEGYHLVPLVDLKILRYEDRRLLATLSSMRCVVTGQSSSSIAGSSSNSCLTSAVSSLYLHPLGRVGRRNCVGIFVALLDGRGQLIDQHNGVFTREAKSCQVGSEQRPTLLRRRIRSVFGWPAKCGLIDTLACLACRLAKYRLVKFVRRLGKIATSLVRALSAASLLNARIDRSSGFSERGSGCADGPETRRVVQGVYQLDRS